MILSDSGARLPISRLFLCLAPYIDLIFIQFNLNSSTTHWNNLES